MRMRSSIGCVRPQSNRICRSTGLILCRSNCELRRLPLHWTAMDYEALWLTLRLALSTTVLLLLIALPLARWIVSGVVAGRALVQAVLALPLVLPPTVVGFYLLSAIGALTP